MRHLTHLKKNKLFYRIQRCTALAVQRFFMLRGVNHNPLIINGKIRIGKRYGIRLQKTCLWRLNSLTLTSNLHVIENQCRARRKNNKGGVSKSRNSFLTRHHFKTSE